MVAASLASTSGSSLVAQFKRCSLSTRARAGRHRSRRPARSKPGSPRPSDRQPGDPRPPAPDATLTCRRPSTAGEDTGGKGLRPKTGGPSLPGSCSGNFRPRTTNAPTSGSPAGVAALRGGRWLCPPAPRPRAPQVPWARERPEPCGSRSGSPARGRSAKAGKEPA